MIDSRPVDQPRRIAVYVQMDDGLLRILAPRKRVDSTTTRVFIGWMVGLSVLLLSLAIYFMSRQVRPIRRLAWAADNFGKGRDVGDFKLAGPTEIRQAGAAFNLMRKRILRHLGQRTEMLAAVSHDLRTPLTRMKLELEMLAGGKAEQGDLDDLRSDVEEMAKIVEGYLAFARGEGQEAIEIADMGALLQEIAERARAEGTEVTTLLEKPVKLPLQADRDPPLRDQSGPERCPPCPPDRDPGDHPRRSGLDRHRRRRPGHPRRAARGGVQGVLPPRPLAQPDHRRHRPRPDHRPRHRPRPRRRPRARQLPAGGLRVLIRLPR